MNILKTCKKQEVLTELAQGYFILPMLRLEEQFSYGIYSFDSDSFSSQPIRFLQLQKNTTDDKLKTIATFTISGFLIFSQNKEYNIFANYEDAKQYYLKMLTTLDNKDVN